MASYAKFCNCRACREGRRRSPQSRASVKAQLRAYRRRAKQLVRVGKEPPVTVSIDYTD